MKIGDDMEKFTLHEAIAFFKSIGITTLVDEDIEAMLATAQAADLLHMLMCKEQHLASESPCDYYFEKSKDKERWRGLVVEQAVLLGLSPIEYQKQLQSCVVLLERTSGINLHMLAWLANQVAERAPQRLSSASETSAASFLPLGEGTAE